MRLSDILKKTNTPAGAPQQPHTAPETTAPSSPPAPPPVPAEKADKDIPLNDQPAAAPVEITAESAYTNTLAELKNITSSIENNAVFNDPVASIGVLAQLVARGDDELLSLADRATPDVYLPGHSVNDCIFALSIGTVLGLDGTRLQSLGYCALLHDMGMLRHLPAVMKKGKLSSTEFEQVKKHVSFGKELARLLPRLPAETKEILPDVVEQVHERADGSGYPAGRELDDIHLYARIIAVTDVYEALTHPRSYRDRHLPHEALKLMINSAESAFDQSLLKAFLERISLYPPASYVRLNTDEIARVVGANKGMPTRPRVKLILDPQLQKIREARTVDLNTTPLLFIKDAVDETKLTINDKKTLLELRARRWWVRGI